MKQVSSFLIISSFALVVERNRSLNQSKTAAHLRPRAVYIAFSLEGIPSIVKSFGRLLSHSRGHINRYGQAKMTNTCLQTSSFRMNLVNGDSNDRSVAKCLIAVEIVGQFSSTHLNPLYHDRVQYCSSLHICVSTFSTSLLSDWSISSGSFFLFTIITWPMGFRWEHNFHTSLPVKTVTYETKL